MAAPIQSPAKCEVRSVIRFLNAEVERPAEIHKLLLFIVTLWIGKLWRTGAVNSPKEIRRRWWGARSHDVVQRAGGRLVWLWDTEARSKA